MSPIAKIKAAYSENRLIPFIGSGFSKKVAPDWDNFIIKLFRNSTDKKNVKKFNDNLEKLEYYIISQGNGDFEKGKRKLVNYIDKTLTYIISKSGSTSKTNIDGLPIDLDVHDLFCEKFKDRRIYTTNWDNLIEEVGSFPVFRNRKDILEKGCDKGVIKFHGSVGSTRNNYGDELIICKSDYWNRISHITPFDILFQSDFLEKKILFIGYSLRDLNVSLTIYQLEKLISHVNDNKRRIFWAVAEYRDNPRVITLAEHSKMEPYFLLNMKNEKFLRKIDKEIKKKCRYCKLKNIFNHSTAKLKGSEICNNCEDIRILKDNYRLNKEKFTENGIKRLLKQLN